MSQIITGKTDCLIYGSQCESRTSHNEVNRDPIVVSIGHSDTFHSEWINPDKLTIIDCLLAACRVD